MKIGSSLLVCPLFLTNPCNSMISCHPSTAAAFSHYFEQVHFCSLHLLCCFDRSPDFEQNFQSLPVWCLEAAGYSNQPDYPRQQHYFFPFTPPYFGTLFIWLNLNSSHSMIRYNSSKLQADSISSSDPASRRSYRIQLPGQFRRPTN